MARDLSVLIGAGYRVERCVPVDLFGGAAAIEAMTTNESLFFRDRLGAEFVSDGTTVKTVHGPGIELSIDGGGYLSYLAPTRVNLNLMEERWPNIDFRATREH